MKFKNNIVLIIFSIIILNITSINIYAKDLTPEARYAIAMDAKSKQVLYEKNGYNITPMASTTKIITALVAINYGNLDEEVTISPKATSIRGSRVGYRAGEKITLRELVYGLMLKSGNDAAIAIAEHLGGSIEGFSIMMNNMAKNIGLLDSSFESPHGLDSQNHYTTAYDLALVTSKAMENEFFREVVGVKEITKDKYNFTRDYRNINKILWAIPNANGVKTGYTGQAGKCLVTSVNHEGRDVIIVLINCTPRWKVTEDIYKYVKENYDFKEEAIEDLIKDSSINPKLVKEDKFYYVTQKGVNYDKEVVSYGNNKKIPKGGLLGKIILKEDQNKEVKCQYIYKN
jgi:D-alanyl-D-alanine carboxypeptidase